MIKSWSWTYAFSALPLKEMRASLYATKEVLWLSHLLFIANESLSAFIIFFRV